MKFVNNLLLVAAVSIAAVGSAHASCMQNASPAKYTIGPAMNKPVKGDKSAYIPMSPRVAQLPIKGDIFANRNGDLKLYPDTQEGNAPACYRLKPEFLVSYGAGLGIYGSRLFHSTADNTG